MTTTEGRPDPMQLAGSELDYDKTVTIRPPEHALEGLLSDLEVKAADFRRKVQELNEGIEGSIFTYGDIVLANPRFDDKLNLTGELVGTEEAVRIVVPVEHIDKFSRTTPGRQDN